MAQIKILPFEESQKIAAGEVVERPASVVKELLENALDAGATRIALTVHDGGKQLIRITDNGCGMSVDDARLCIAKHATSKITSVEQLPTIGTFGFRGEALAALAAVSRMTIITKQADAAEGVKLTIENGSVLSQEPTAAQTGTTIEIAELFYNVPARQKFLKKRETELRHIQQLFNAMCMANPQLHATLYSDDTKLAQFTAVNSLLDRCTQMHARTDSNTLLSVDAHTAVGHITGVISDHQWFRYDRSGIMLFVNKRWVKNQHVVRALLRGYNNVLPPGRFPFAVLMLDMSGTEVDVNVHPRKEEVQFSHERRVDNAVRDTIKATLDAAIAQKVEPIISAHAQSAVRSLHVEQSIKNNYDYTLPKQSFIPAPEQFAVGPQKPFTYSFVSDMPHVQKELSHGAHISMHQSAALDTALITPASHATEQNYSFLGQLHKTYILIQVADELVIIDQHAAHECILYELFAQRFADVATVALLFPELITLTASDWSVLQPHMSVLEQNGIKAELFGENQLRVTAVPVHIKHASITDIVRSIIGNIVERKTDKVEDIQDVLHKKLRAQMACKAAVKAGDVLTEVQMREIVRDLYKTKERLTCPHGRPTCWNISQYELEKKFKRVI